MNPRHEDEASLPPDDQAFVRRLAEVYSPPARMAAERVSFQAKLEERLRGRARRTGLSWTLAAMATAAAATFLVRDALDRSALDPAPKAVVVASVARAADTEAVQQEAILALTLDSDTASDEALPADYEAIASVFMGG